jgi:hypothetical protein
MDFPGWFYPVLSSLVFTSNETADGFLPAQWAAASFTVRFEIRFPWITVQLAQERHGGLHDGRLKIE